MESETSVKGWEGAGLRLPQLDDVGKEGVSISCINCSDFIVGKQTNFNGPVTIICCSDAWNLIRDEKCHQRNDLVIRDEVLSPTAATRIHRLAEEKTKEGKKSAKRNLLLVVCAGVLLGTAVALALLFTTASTGEDSHPECFLLPNNVTCVYFGVLGEGSGAGKPLPAPTEYVIVFQTHGEYCYEVSACLEVVKSLPRNGTTACSFLLGGDGNAYEDEGWKSPEPFRLCFAGNFTEEDFPTHPQVVAAQALVAFGLDRGFVAEDYVLAASNATSPENSLASIYKIISKWPHFKANPFPLDFGRVEKQNVPGNVSPR